MSGYYIPEPQSSSALSQPAFTPVTSNAYGAAAEESFVTAPVYSAFTGIELGLQETLGNPIDEMMARKRASEFGVSLGEEFYKDTTYAALDNRIQMKQSEMRRQFILSEIEGSTALSTGLFATGVGVQFLDFANIASAYVPVAGLPAMTRAMKAGHSVTNSAMRARVLTDAATKTAGYGKRFAVGALEGSVGAAITEAAVLPLQQYAGADYTLSDSMLNIAMGAPFGAVLHAAPKAFTDVRNKLQARKYSTSLTPEIITDFKDMTGEMLDVPAGAAARVSNEMIVNDLQGLDMPDELLEAAGLIGEKANTTDSFNALMNLAEIAPEEYKPTIMEKAAKLKADLEEASNFRAVRSETEIKNLLGHKKPPESLSQFVRRMGGISDVGGDFKSQDMVQFGKGSGIVQPADKSKQGGLFGAGGKSVKGIDTMLSEARQNGFYSAGEDVSTDRFFNDIIADANETDLFKRKYTEDTTVRLADALASDKYQLTKQMDAAGITKDMDVGDIAQILMTEHVEAAAKIHNAPQHLRDAAFTVANAQMLDGRPIDIEKVIDGSEPLRPLQELAEQHYEADDLDAYNALQSQIAELTKIYDNHEKATELHVADAQRMADEPLEFSRGEGKTGSDAASLSVDVRNAFGKYTEKLYDASRLNVVQSVADLPKGFDYASADGRAVKGVKFPDGRVFIVADHVEPHEVRGLVLHEVGVHVGMRNMLGSEKFDALLADIMSSTDPRAERARANVPKDTPPEHIAEEALAYMVQDAPEAGFVTRAFAAIRAWLYKTFGKQFLIDEYALRHMAVGALKRVSSLGERSDGAGYVDIINTADFKAKFDGSKAVDKSGAAIKLYHGGAAVEKLRAGGEKGETEQAAIYLTSERGDSQAYANKAMRETGSAMTHIGYAVIKNPLVIDDVSFWQKIRDRNKPYRKTAKAQQARKTAFFPEGRVNELKAQGYDGAINKATDEFIVFSPEQIIPAYGDVKLSRAPEQTTIPGTEKISDKQLAERKMEQPLAAKKQQREMDVGLFAPEDKQTTLFFSRAAEPPKPQDMKALGAELKGKLAPFDNALKMADKYPEIFRTALKYISNDAALAQRLKSSGVDSDMIQMIIGELKLAHRKTGNALRKELHKLKAEDISESFTSDADMQSIVAAAQVKEKIMLAKRNIAINFAVRQRLLQHARGFGVEFFGEGVLAKISGSAMMRSGARDSAAANIQAFAREYTGMLDVALRKQGLKEQFTSRALDRQIASAMERLDDAAPDFKGINADAVKIANIMADIQENLRLTQNRYGAYIKKRQNFSVHQSYDTIKVAKSSIEDFTKAAKDSWNLALMTDGNLTKADRMIQEIYYELKTGVHEIDIPNGDIDHDFRTGSSVAKKVSMARTIVFKKDKWYDFNAKFGSGDFTTNYFKGIEHGSRAAGLMKVLGTNPEYTIDNIHAQLMQEAKDAGNYEAAAKLKKQITKIKNNLATVDGSTEIPGNVLGAKIGSNIRLWQMMSKLGTSISSSLVDIANYGANVRYEGRGGMFGGMGEALAGLAARNSDGVRRQVLDQLDVTFDHLQADMMQALLKGNTFTHNMSALGRMYSKLNFQRPWTTQLQKSEAIGLAHYLGANSAKKFDNLDMEASRLLTIHGIDANKWEIMRQAAKKMDDGRTYLLTDALNDISDDVFAKYVKQRGVTVNATSLKNARDSIGESYRAMLIDRIDSAVVSGDKRAQAAVTRGTQRGTILGEANRLTMQFKSYPVTYWERVVKREIYSRGYDTMGDYMRNGKGDMLGFAGLIAAQMALGYAGLSIKDAIKGKTPRSLARPGTWVEMMRQSGAAGLYGDLLFNEYNKSIGASLIAGLAGPSLGAASDLADVASAAARGDKFAVNLTRAIMGNVPGANLIYVKPALDNLIMYQLYENMNPGFIRRMERTAESKGQEWLLRPSQTLR